MSDTAHAELGASNAARWMACPGSVRLSRGLPNRETAYAQEGTAAHALAEACLRRGVLPEMFIGTEFHGVEVTPEMAEYVSLFVNACRVYIASDYLTSIEQRFTLASLHPPGAMFGTADFVAYSVRTGTLYVVDLKYGSGVVVEAKGNKQLRYYALGAALAFGVAPVYVHMTIVQPRVLHPEGPVRTDTISGEELLEFAGELMEAAYETTKSDAPLNPGAHCRFCPTQATCPALHRMNQLVAQAEFSEMPAARPVNPETLSDAQIGDILSKLPIMDAWMTAVRQHAHDRLALGAEVPGYKLVEKRATRKWRDPDEAEQYVLALGYREVDVEKRELKSVAQIEKLVGKGKLPADLVVKQSSGTTVAPAHDPRPAVTPGHMFPALPPGAEYSHDADNE